MSRHSKRHRGPKKPKRVIESLEIIDLSTEGQGVARTDDGMVLFVSESAPGDVVSVEVIREKKRHGFAKVLEVEKPSKERVDPVCRYFGTCGGCAWQHMSAEAQTLGKSQILQQVMQRVGKIHLEEAPCIRAPEERYGGRTRLRLQVDRHQRLGLYQRGTKNVVPIEHCPVATEGVNRAWAILNEHLSALHLSLQEVRLLGASDGSVVASFHIKRGSKLSTPKAKKELERWWRPRQGELMPLRGVELLQANNVLLEVGHTILKEGKPDTMYRPSGFAQASWVGNALLVEEVLAAYRRNPVRNILEMYAGCGNLSLALAQEGAYVWALDSNVQALQDGQISAKAHQLQQQVQFEVFDDHHNSLPVYCEHADVDFEMLVLDPPRRGIASRVREEILSLRIPKVIYVSCDPGTLARDLRVFLEAGYQLDSLSGVDIMPQTAHIESVASLSLK